VNGQIFVLHSPVPDGAVGEQTKNPYILDHNPCGSSAGSAVAVAANLCVVAVGTETDGSVVCPSAVAVS
jgi:amidase